MTVIAVFEHDKLALSAAQARRLDECHHLLPNGAVTWEGPHTVRFSQFCGLLPLGEDILEILPKIDRSSSAAQGRTALLNMLAETEQIDADSCGDAAAHTQQNLLDLFIGLFAREALGLARQGLFRQYQTIDDDLPLVRGRLHTARMAAQGPARMHISPCQFDELTVDNQVNRIIKAAALCAWPVAKSGEARRKVREVLFLLDEVQCLPGIRAADIGKLTQTRQSKRYRKILAHCRWLLDCMAPDLRAGDASGWGLLFDMNKLFQNYVFARVRRQLASTDFSVRAEEPRKWLFDQPKKYQLRPDIVVQQGTETLAILDAKWKCLGAEDPAQGDVYQMVTYWQRYQPKRLVLVYPQSTSTAECRKFVCQNGPQLEVCFMQLPGFETVTACPPWVNELTQNL